MNEEDGIFNFQYLISDLFNVFCLFILSVLLWFFYWLIICIMYPQSGHCCKRALCSVNSPWINNDDDDDDDDDDDIDIHFSSLYYNIVNLFTFAWLDVPVTACFHQTMKWCCCDVRSTVWRCCYWPRIILNLPRVCQLAEWRFSFSSLAPISGHSANLSGWGGEGWGHNDGLATVLGHQVELLRTSKKPNRTSPLIHNP